MDETLDVMIYYETETRPIAVQIEGVKQSFDIRGKTNQSENIYKNDIFNGKSLIFSLNTIEASDWSSIWFRTAKNIQDYYKTVYI